MATAAAAAASRTEGFAADRVAWLTTILLAAATAELRAQRPPTAVLRDPAHLDTAVDPETRTLEVRFDQDMQTGHYSVCGGGPSFPEVTGITWPNARTFRLGVELEPDRVYVVDLSCRSAKGFWSEAGRLAPTPWRFATAGPAIDRPTTDRVATALFTALRDRYSYRDRLPIDWHDFETRTYAHFIGCRSMAALALTMTEMLAVPQDPHIVVQWRDARLPTCHSEGVSNFDVAGVRQVLPDLRRVGSIGLTARTEDGIGYLFVGSFARRSAEQFELCLAALRELSDCRALVLDVRQNGGGDERLAARLAGFFVSEPAVYARHRSCAPDSDDGLGPVQDRTVAPNAAPDVHHGPVAVLMGQRNMSSCEAFLLMMRQVADAELLGDRSFGSSGNPKPHALAPGLVVHLPSWQALLPDGTLLEGRGIEPTVPVATPSEVLGKDDPVLRTALERLRRRLRR